MLTPSRQLVTLEMLCQDMQMALHEECDEADMPDEYLQLLTQIIAKLKAMELDTSDLTDRQFSELLAGAWIANCIDSRQMLKVQITLLSYVSDYYQLSEKITQLLSHDFSEQADKHLNLLQSKRIKLKKQYMTVATAMGEKDYQDFIQTMALAQNHWGWSLIDLN